VERVPGKTLRRYSPFPQARRATVLHLVPQAFPSLANRGRGCEPTLHPESVKRGDKEAIPGIHIANYQNPLFQFILV